MALSDTIVNGFSDLLKKVESEYIEKLQEKDDTIQQLQERVDELSQYHKIDEILDEIEENEQKYQSKDKSDAVTHDNITNMEENKEDEDDDDSKKKTPQFWKNLDKKLQDDDIEFIKELVRNKEIKMDDVNDKGRNLLMLAVQYGKYELCSMCINLGANIDREDLDKVTALKLAKSKGFPDIEELILMNMQFSL